MTTERKREIKRRRHRKEKAKKLRARKASWKKWPVPAPRGPAGQERKRMGRWWPPRTSNPVGRRKRLRWVRFPPASASLYPIGSSGNRSELRADEQEEERSASLPPRQRNEPAHH